ncbi:hypothetical protein Y032_0060g3104 [Ancylostoma ceylanicum]|uniref:Uncharacterized protein n=1 Tax=Ancylostoma ceylanicum TaxID=53326 RepID=A0A016U283_9BILA|nr:hypothetical protein Y032_0060g3104 [Ancylostoma ceylanicum]
MNRFGFVKLCRQNSAITVTTGHVEATTLTDNLGRRCTKGNRPSISNNKECEEKISFILTALRFRTLWAYLTSPETPPEPDWVNEYLPPARAPLPEAAAPAVDVQPLRERVQKAQHLIEPDWVNAHLPLAQIPLPGFIEAKVIDRIEAMDWGGQSEAIVVM